MQRLGVKKVLVGGQYLQVYARTDWDTGSFSEQLQAKGNDYLNDKTLGNCVGVTIHELAKKFQVEISSIAFPHRRARAYGKAFGPVNAVVEKWK